MPRFWQRTIVNNSPLISVVFIVMLFIPVLFFNIPVVNAVDCPLGYRWTPRAGIDCSQINCSSVKDAHYGYTGHCICGSAGSISENPDDPNYDCKLPADHTACPNCVYACVHTKDECPNTQNIMVGQNKCIEECRKLMGGGSEYSEILEASGSFPNCNCIVDVKDKGGRITRTVKLVDGDKKTTLTFDPSSGALKDTVTVSLEEEREKIRIRLGFQYTERQIDALLEDEKINEFFNNRMSNIETSTSLFTPAFWWQHVIALFDHGFGESADFVDIHHYGRCGDSMMWLERELAKEIKLGDKRYEAFVSITGEKYKNIINHTSILVRPPGVPNDEWEELMIKLRDKSRSTDMTREEFQNTAPDLLDAKVLDPYYKKVTTVRDFIKGWSVIKIS